MILHLKTSKAQIVNKYFCYKFRFLFLFSSNTRPCRQKLLSRPDLGLVFPSLRLDLENKMILLVIYSLFLEFLFLFVLVRLLSYLTFGLAAFTPALYLCFCLGRSEKVKRQLWQLRKQSKKVELRLIFINFLHEHLMINLLTMTYKINNTNTISNKLNQRYSHNNKNIHHQNFHHYKTRPAVLGQAPA